MSLVTDLWFSSKWKCLVSINALFLIRFFIGKWKMSLFVFISVQLHIVWNICFSSWQSFFSSFCVQVTQGCNFNLRVWFHTESLHIITNQFVLGSKLKKSLLLIFDTSTYSTTKSRFLPWAMWVCCLPQYGTKFSWAEPCPSSII